MPGKLNGKVIPYTFGLNIKGVILVIVMFCSGCCLPFCFLPWFFDFCKGEEISNVST